MIGIRWLSRGLPKSLVGRVFALYTTALLLFVGGALALFYRFQFSRELEAALERADGLISVVAPAISDNAVIGMVLSGGNLTFSNCVATLTGDSSVSSNPPPGFFTPIMKPAAGGFAQTVN